MGVVLTSRAAAQVAGFAAAYDAVGDMGARNATKNFFDIVTQHHRHAADEEPICMCFLACACCKSSKLRVACCDSMPLL